jgi:hypothetical protein
LSIEELEAAVGWLERNRIRDHLGLIEDDAHYRWSSRRQRSARHQAAMKWAKPQAAGAAKEASQPDTISGVQPCRRPAAQ